MIFVTGGAGFIGANFVKYWLNSVADEPVVVLDKFTYAGNPDNLADEASDPRLTIIKGDIGDLEQMTRLLKIHSPRAVLNFAAESHVDRSISGAQDFIDTNIVGTYKLLEAVRGWMDDAPDGFRFLHVSTDEVYGSLGADDPAFREDHQYEPNSPYSASKAASDHLVRAWRETYGLPTVITNCSNNYGPLQFPEKLIPVVIGNALAGEILPIYGDGKQVRDWLFVEDHCRALATVLADGHIGDTYNIGGNCEMTNIDLVRGICTILDTLKPRADMKSYSTQIEYVTDRLGHDRRYAIDTSFIKERLGWQPITTLEKGLQLTVRWYLDNDSWTQRIKSGEYRSAVDSIAGGAS